MSNDLLESIHELERIIEVTKEMMEVTQKGPTKNYTENLLWKKVEDGILDNYYKANEYQKSQMETYNFRYYNEYNKNRNLMHEDIKMRDRKRKLKEL